MSDELFPDSLFAQSSQDSLDALDELEFFESIDEVFDDQDPFGALLGSSMLAQFTQPDNNPLGHQNDEFPTVSELVDMFLRWEAAEPICFSWFGTRCCPILTWVVTYGCSFRSFGAICDHPGREVSYGWSQTVVEPGVLVPYVTTHE